jgi:subtilisin-like proprotein convertase family protein
MMSLFLVFSLTGCSKKESGINVAYMDIPGPDPLAVYMWPMEESTHDYVNGHKPVAGSSINLGMTHDHYTGAGVFIVISDSSVELTHPELWTNAHLNFSKDYRTPYPYFGTPSSSDNSDGHGTAVASLAVGKKNNSQGGHGVAPDAALIGTNFISSDQSLSKAIDQATLDDVKGIFNYSYGYSNCQINPGDGEDYVEVLRNGTIGKGHVYVTASGNDFAGTLDECGGEGSKYFFGNANYDQVKSYPYLIVVGANSAAAVSADYSTPGANVWVSAPGGGSEIGIMVADLVGCSLGFTNDATDPFDRVSSSLNPKCSYYSAAMGTSFASPIVTGAIGILRQINPDLSWRDIKHILAKTATKIHSTAGPTMHPLTDQDLAGHTYQQGWVVNKASYPFHPWYGFGQINLSQARILAENPDFDLRELKVTDNMANNPGYTSGNVNLSIPDRSSAGVTNSINVNKHDLFIEHVQIKVTITHPSIQDLGIELTSPLNTTTKIMNINSSMVGANLSEATFGVNAFDGERSKGAWILKLIDGATGEQGSLVSWSISIIGNRGEDFLDTSPPDPISGLTYTGSNLSWAASSSIDVVRTEICMAPVAMISNGCGDGDWRSLYDQTLFTPETFIYQGLVGLMNSGSEYMVKMRTIDSSENESPIISYSWTQL